MNMSSDHILRKMQGKQHRQTGFTLIEMLIVVAVAAILTAIAYPSYIEQVRRSALVEAGDQLTATKVMMDQFYTSHRSFTTATAAGGPCVTQTGKSFTLTCMLDGANPLNYLLTSTGIAGTRAAGFTYTIDQNGVRTTRVTGLAGWPATANCWIFKKGDSC